LLHFEDGPAAEGLVDNIPQPSVIRLVHRQHIVGERAQGARHPPLEPATLPSSRRRVKVSLSFKYPIG
jgi:hypothetical protein